MERIPMKKFYFDPVPEEEMIDKEAEMQKVLADFEFRREKARQEDEESEAAREKKFQNEIGRLRKIDYSSLPFENCEKLVEVLHGKEYLDQMVSLESAFENNFLSLEGALELFGAAKDNKTRLAIIENLPKVGAWSEDTKKRAMEYLVKISTDGFDDRDSKQIDIFFGQDDELGDLYIASNYLFDPHATDENEAVFLSAPIVSLSRFGKRAELSLIEITKRRWADLNVEGAKEFWGIDLSKPKEEYFYDKRGNVTDERDKEIIDAHYVYTSLTLYGLKEIGTHQTIDLIVESIVKQNYLFQVYHKEFLDILTDIDKKYATEKILEDIASDSESEKNYFGIILTLTDLIGAEEALKKINSLIIENEKMKNNEATENLKFARTYLVPTKDKEIFAELESFYRKFNIKEHQINKDLNEKEVLLLQEIIPRGSKILESGCGTGRLLLEMKKAGYDISGYDLSPENIEEIKKEDPEADVSIEDWHHTPYAEESFDAVYSLGRNILHEYSLPGQVQIFREAARVLKKGGQFIFDIADREKGAYAENRKKYKELMNAKGIYNLREGTIHDSPNGEHFATRYAYSNEDIENLAQLAGFRIVEVRREELPTGKGDENLYYVLEKI